MNGIYRNEAKWIVHKYRTLVDRLVSHGDLSDNLILQHSYTRIAQFSRWIPSGSQVSHYWSGSFSMSKGRRPEPSRWSGVRAGVIRTSSCLASYRARWLRVELLTDVCVYMGLYVFSLSADKGGNSL